MSLKTYAPEEVIFNEGDSSDFAYVIDTGEVEIFRDIKGNIVRLAILGEGDIFGEMGLIDERPRSASAKTLTEVALIHVDHDQFFEMIRSNPDASIPIVRALFDRLRMMNERYLEMLDLQPANVVAEAGYRLRVLPLTAEVGELVAEDGVEIQSFPFRVGREQTKGEHSPLDVNDLAFADSKPYNLSRNHFQVEKTDGKIMVRDCRSNLGTIVNGTRIGGQARDLTMALSPGDNEVVAGIEESPYRFRLIAEPASS